MRNIKLTLAYDGTGFHGWQAQPGCSTIQGLLAESIEKLTQERPTVVGAGRTDAGVHAWGQVANFETGSRMSADEFLRALNSLLPQQVRVRAAEEVASEFHARYSARDKTYRYRIYRGRVLSPFCVRYVLHEPHALDFAAMAGAARAFEGVHDFTSFAASTGSEEEDRDRTTTREILQSEWSRVFSPAPDAGVPGGTPGTEGEEWVYLIRGRSFLRHMVRIIVGTLLEVGRRPLAPSEISELLVQRDRSAAGPTAPAQGLCLHSVEYPPAV
jgi:tRNA pseudouridine38-40 synthase